MNKIYKIVWSKVKNCYVVASELAKSRTKAPKSNVFSKILVAGVLACVLCPTSLVLARDYSSNSYEFEFIDDSSSQTIAGDTITGIRIMYATETGYNFNKVFSIGASGSSSSSSDPNAIYSLSVNGRTITYTKGNGATGTITTQDTDTTYSAGYGVSLSGTTFSARPGTNVTVNGNGINVTGNGSVASGDTGLIDGGKLYSEVRPSDNGNYVKPVKIQHAESFCYAKTPGLCPSLKKQAVLFFLRPVHERAV